MGAGAAVSLISSGLLFQLVDQLQEFAACQLRQELLGNGTPQRGQGADAGTLFLVHGMQKTSFL